MNYLLDPLAGDEVDEAGARAAMQTLVTGADTRRFVKRHAEGVPRCGNWWRVVGDVSRAEPVP